MEIRKRPSMRAAVFSTVAAVGGFMAPLVLLTVVRDKHGLEMAIVLLVSMATVVSAIVQWVTYFQEWVRFEIENHEERTKTKQ